MQDKDSPGVLEKVKRGIMTAFESGSTVRKSQISGLNLPARLARCDTAYNSLTALFKSKLYMLDDSERYRYYTLGLTLVNVVIDNLTFIYREHSPVSAAVKKTEDPCMPLLLSCRKILELLKISDMSISEIGKRVGYSDKRIFLAAFRKILGVSPSIYRQRTRNFALYRDYFDPKYTLDESTAPTLENKE